jgi:hypothetical protein
VTRLDPSDPAAPQRLTTDPETAARLTVALAAGDVVVVPQAALAAVDAGWWAISPATADTRAVWGRDINSSKFYRGAPYGGSSGPSVNYVDPKTLNGSTPSKYSRGGGSEEAVILVTVSIPGGVVLRVTAGRAVAAIAVAAAALLAYQLAG